MSNVQLTVSYRFDPQMQMQNGSQKYCVSLSKELNTIWQKSINKNGVFDQGRKKLFMERKLTYRQYHVQDNADVSQKDVKIYCNTNKLPGFSFCVPHSKPHGAGGLSKHYHLRFAPKIGNVVCAISRISCACVACTSIIDKPGISGIPSDKQEHYKTATNCMHFPVLGTFNNWNIIQL